MFQPPTLHLIRTFGSIIKECASDVPNTLVLRNHLQEVDRISPFPILWRKFFAPQHVFLAAVKFFKLGLDHRAILNVFTNWNPTFWRETKTAIDADGLQVAEEFMASMKDEKERQNHLDMLIAHLLDHDAAEEALRLIPQLKWSYLRCIHWLTIAQLRLTGGRNAEGYELLDRVLREVRERPETLNDGDDVLDHILDKVIHVWCKNGKPEKALEVVPDFTSPHSRCNAMIEIARTMSRREDPKPVWRIYRLATQEAYDPEVEHPEAYLPWIMAGMEALGMQEQAGQILPLSYMLNDGHHLDTLLRTLTDTGNYERVKELIDKLKKPWEKVNYLLLLAIGMQKAGSHVADELITEALRLMPEDRMGASQCVAERLADVHQVEEALAVARGIQDYSDYTEAEDQQVWAFDQILLTMCQQGKADQAIDLARQVDDEYHHASVLMELTDVLTWMGDPERARSVADEAWLAAQKLEEVPYRVDPAEHLPEWKDDSFKGAVLNRLGRAFMALGEWEAAERVLVEMEGKHK